MTLCPACRLNHKVPNHFNNNRLSCMHVCVLSVGHIPCHSLLLIPKIKRIFIPTDVCKLMTEILKYYCDDKQSTAYKTFSDTCCCTNQI